MLSRPFTPHLEEHDIDNELGFVPGELPALPDYYLPWCKLVSNLPKLLEAGTLQANVDSLETLDTDHMECAAHWKRAYVILGYLTQAYIWQKGTEPTAIVPPALGEPFLRVCEYLGMRPVLSYAGLCIWNWQTRHPSAKGHLSSPLNDFEEIVSFASFTGTRDEDAFNLVPVLVEARGGQLVRVILDAIAARQKGEVLDLTPTLRMCATIFQEMGDILSVLHKNCNPTVFYQQVRPWLRGSTEVASDGLPKGVTLSRTNGSNEVVQCVGGSAGQSAFFQFLDHVLGVSHESKMLVEMRAYMPKKHRDLLEAVEVLPSLRDLVDDGAAGADEREALHLVFEAFQQWRTRHVAIVSRYIVQPAAAQARGNPVAEEKGTAGTLPIPFLKQYRDETVFKQRC